MIIIFQLIVSCLIHRAIFAHFMWSSVIKKLLLHLMISSICSQFYVFILFISFKICKIVSSVHFIDLKIITITKSLISKLPLTSSVIYRFTNVYHHNNFDYYVTFAPSYIMSIFLHNTLQQ